jgi:plasmid stabilization system protein ParE
MAKTIVWSAKAQNDRKEILLYWKERNKSITYSRKLNYLFNDAAGSISKFPKIGKPTGYKDTRVKIVRVYLMVYKEYDNHISIITIWDGRQNPLKLERIIR